MAPAVSPCTCYFQYQATFWISSILRESVGHQVQLGTPQKTSRNEQAASEEKCQPTKPMQTKHATQTKAKQTNLTIVNHGKRNQPTNQPNLTNVINQTTQKKKKKKHKGHGHTCMLCMYGGRRLPCPLMQCARWHANVLHVLKYSIVVNVMFCHQQPRKCEHQLHRDSSG